MLSWLGFTILLQSPTFASQNPQDHACTQPKSFEYQNSLSGGTISNCVGNFTSKVPIEGLL